VVLNKKFDVDNVIVGFMFIGMGLGWLLGHLVAGLFIGLGLGLVAQALMEGKESASGLESATSAPEDTSPRESASATATGDEVGKTVISPEKSGNPGIDIEAVWSRIVAHQGETFHLLKGQAFTYRVEGNAVVPSTTQVKIHKSQFAKALSSVPFKKVADVPKDVFGPSYVYAILMDPRIRDGDW